MSSEGSWPDTGGRLIYAVGDVHGRDDLLDGLLAEIVQDSKAPNIASIGRPLLIMLGDYIDRGPASRQVIDRLLAFPASHDFEIRCLLGNHEAALLEFLDRKIGGEGWVRRGGGATMLSYGVIPPPPGSARSAWSSAREDLRQALPTSHLRFFRDLSLYEEEGGYIFVHAGIRPGIAIADQQVKDLLWIRDDFLLHKVSGPKTIVHGHTPSEAPYLGLERIGLDTGAYLSGVLTAVRLNGKSPDLLAFSLSSAPRGMGEARK